MDNHVPDDFEFGVKTAQLFIGIAIQNINIEPPKTISDGDGWWEENKQKYQIFSNFPALTSEKIHQLIGTYYVEIDSENIPKIKESIISCAYALVRLGSNPENIALAMQYILHVDPITQIFLPYIVSDEAKKDYQQQFLITLLDSMESPIADCVEVANQVFEHGQLLALNPNASFSYFDNETTLAQELAKFYSSEQTCNSDEDALKYVSVLSLCIEYDVDLNSALHVAEQNGNQHYNTFVLSRKIANDTSEEKEFIPKFLTVKI